MAHDVVAAADHRHLHDVRLPGQGVGPSRHGEQEAVQPPQHPHRLQRLPDCI